MARTFSEHANTNHVMRAIIYLFCTTICDSFSSPTIRLHPSACNFRRNGFQSSSSFELRHASVQLCLKSSLSPEDSRSDRIKKGDDIPWQVGDFESDMQILRSAVALCNAQVDLAEKERLLLLDEFAKQRRELVPDLKRYIILPLLLSGFFSIFLSLPNTHNMKKLAIASMRFSNISFWVMSVILPLIMHIYAARTKNEKRTRIRKSEWDAEFIDPRQDCSDFSRCILENCASSAIPSALVGLTTLIVKQRNLIIVPKYHILNWKMATVTVQMLSRLGAAASMHQFPILLYQLQRSNQIRPTPLLPTTLYPFVNWSLRMLPYSFAIDLAQVYSNFRSRKTAAYSLLEVCRPSTTISAIAYSLLALMAIAQICHIVAFASLIQVGQFTNISLATSASNAQKLLEDKSGASLGIKLRYKFQWRSPVRLRASFRLLGRKLALFIFSGWGEDASIVEDGSSRRVPHILKLIKKDMEKMPDGAKIDRTTWIPLATRSMAAVHQDNYEKQSFEDPLGIALQQTFGIGLSLDFDHNSKLNEGERPSIHRLRARAAKSAIRRYNQIPEIFEGADVEKEREKLTNLVKELVTLIPSNAYAPEGKSLDVLSMRQTEAESLTPQGANLPFLNDDNDDDYITDPYLGDDFLGQDTVIT